MEKTIQKKSKFKRLFLPTVSIVAGVGIYLVGVEKGFKRGVIEGHRVGYIQGVSDISSIIKEVKEEFQDI